jgi:hypothetical protein
MSTIWESEILPGLEDTVSTAPPPSEGDWVEIAPGQYLAEQEVDELPRYALAKIVPRRDGLEQDGEFAIELDEESPLGYFRLQKTMKLARVLGMAGLNYWTLRRLCIAGFVDYLELAPHTTFVSIDSLKEHMEATRNSKYDGDSFWTEERLERWRETCGM